MAYDLQKAKTLQAALAQGLTLIAALDAAGIDINDVTNYVIDSTGTPADNPNYGSVEPPGADLVSDTEYPVVSVVLGGASTVVVQPTKFLDTAQSRALQTQADQFGLQQQIRAAELKAQGKTGAEILNDSVYYELSERKTAAQLAANNAKTPVSGTGAVVVSPTPNNTQTSITAQPGTPATTTQNAADSDQTIALQQANAVEAFPAATSFNTDQPVVPNLSVEFDPETQTFGIWDNAEGRLIETGYSSESAAEQDLRDSGATLIIFDRESRLEAEQQFIASTAEQEAANSAAAILDTARAQAAINERRRQINQGDWRAKLSLAPLANYLYKAASPGILQPLTVTDGVVFPYTPKIDLSYRAMYDTASLTHTNYNNYFYKSSLLDPVNLTATFTAQDTSEANYLLAVIHFFRSVTKMFYGQDPERGAPPPLVFFSGLGEYQFAEHPCLVHQFNYSLPSDVDYIRARSVMDSGVDLQDRRDRQSVSSNTFSAAGQRLKSLGQNIQPGAEPKPPAPVTFGTNSPTYVPTRIDISLILYPVQSRSQVSKQFSLQQYANGDLLKGGFW